MSKENVTTPVEHKPWCTTEVLAHINGHESTWLAACQIFRATPSHIQKQM